MIKTDIGKENSIAVPLIEEMIERIKRSTNDHAEKQVEYEIVDVPLGTFCRRYLYTSLILSIRR